LFHGKTRFSRFVNFKAADTSSAKFGFLGRNKCCQKVIIFKLTSNKNTDFILYDVCYPDLEAPELACETVYKQN